jgi:putative ABC transport system ATP-binding protein
MMSTPAAVLELHGLAKAYGGQRVYAGVDLRIARGEFVALLGESGVGKSTLLNGIAGLDAPSAGRVVVDGVDVGALAEPAQAAWRRRTLGFVFQAFHLLPHLSVGDNVGLPLLLLGRREPQRVAAMLAAVGLAGYEARLPRTLSGGQLQRVAIARALVHTPRLLLADEPTGNLDPETAARVVALLVAQVRAAGAAALMVTHSAQAAAHADRVLRLTTTGIEPA